MQETTLALLRGTPAIPGGPPPWPRALPEVEEAIKAVYASGDWGRYHGEQVCALEEELKHTFGVKHAFTCASGTMAVEVALKAVGVKPGGEVIMGAYDYESSFLTVHSLGARPVLVDAKSNGPTLDFDSVELGLGETTQAILATHLHGEMVDIAKLRERYPRVAIVEDAAQTAGGSVNGRMAGSMGDVGTLSFGGSKLLTAGRGGAVLCNDAAMAQRVKLILHRGVQQWGPLSELQAAVLRPQLKRLEQDTHTRQQNAELLRSQLDNQKLNMFGKGEGIVPGLYKLGFRFDQNAWKITRELFCKAMRAEGIAFDPGFPALHKSRAPSRFRAGGTLTNASRWHQECVILHHPVLLETPAVMEAVSNVVGKIYSQQEALLARMSHL